MFVAGWIVVGLVSWFFTWTASNVLNYWKLLRPITPGTLFWMVLGVALWPITLFFGACAWFCAAVGGIVRLSQAKFWRRELFDPRDFFRQK